jgi:amino-acid N-acetyltransferase
MKKPQRWKVEKVNQPERETASELISACGLPEEGLGETELWCVKGEGRQLLGVAGLETWGRQGLLRSVAVENEHRKSLVGTSLVRHVISEAEKKRIKEIYLITETAPSFFERLGFSAIDRSRVRGGVLNSVEFKGACPETAPVMRMDLGLLE